MTVAIGGIAEERVPDFLRAMGGPFLFDVADDRIDEEVEQFLDRFEVDRLRCAFDGDRIVATLGAYSFDMTVPGSSIACGGTTVVTVQPTHRRQGILRRLVDAHFDDVRDHGESIAALFASDSAIYGRFGFGLASVSAEIEIDPSTTSPHRLVPPPGPVRMTGPEEARAIAGAVFDRVRPRRPGMFDRNEAWWRATLRDDARDRKGATAYRYVVADGTEGPAGYARYRIKPGHWEGGHGDGAAEVSEILTTTAEAASSLWFFLTNLDLVTSLRAQMLPEDDVVFDLFAGWRRARPTLSDQLWVRLIDVPRALEGRRYAVDGTVGLRVHDPLDGSVRPYRLEVTQGVGSCAVADDGAIEIDAEDLGAAYLGRPRFRSLAAAGRIRGDDASLALADRMFAGHPAPWCQQLF